MTNRMRFENIVRGEPVDRMMTYDLIDNVEILKRYGGYVPGGDYSFVDLVHINARALKGIGVDATRSIYDPSKHWMGSKIENWIRFFGVDPDNWEVKTAGDTAWISKRPFATVSELEKHLPQLPDREEIAAWYKPVLATITEIFDDHDLVFLGGLEGPICDAYTYVDTELFCTAIYDAPEIVTHIMDCCGKFSSFVAEMYAENPSAPIMFMGEDIAGSTGPIFSPDFIREQGLPRWRWITEPLKKKGVSFLFHTDGRYGELLPIILEELGADGLNPIERMDCNDIFDIHANYPDKLLFGNVCCASTLPYGPLDKIEDETLELIEKLAPSGKLLIGSSSEVNDLVPPDYAAKLYSTVKKYGDYPIDVEAVQARRKEIAQAK